VRITKEKLNLIYMKHQEMKKNLNKIGVVLKNPKYKIVNMNVVIKIERNLGRLLFYRKNFFIEKP
jgi:hypothetical protein